MYLHMKLGLQADYASDSASLFWYIEQAKHAWGSGGAGIVQQSSTSAKVTMMPYVCRDSVNKQLALLSYLWNIIFN